MIDFRYHLVSLVAVFLALAVGIVLGTTALNGPIQDSLNGDVTRLSSDKQDLEGELSDLRSQAEAGDTAAERLAPTVLAGALEERRVLIVSTPDAPPQLADRLTELLGQSGAEVSGRLELLPTLTATTSRQLVEDVVARVVPAGLELPEGEPVDRAGAELSAALTRPAGEPGLDPAQAQAVVAAFAQADLVRYTAAGPSEDPADLALVLTGPGEELDEAGSAQRDGLLAVAAAFDERSSGAVVAGPASSAAADGTLAALREDSGSAGAVSGVDGADRGLGALATVLALAEQVRGGAGQYGTAENATAPLPAPAPG